MRAEATLALGIDSQIIMAVLFYGAAKIKEGTMNKQKSGAGAALAGIILGIVGLLLSALPIINNFAAILGVLAVVLGVVGVVKAKKLGNKMTRSIAAILLGIITVAIVLASQAMYSETVNKVGESIDRATGGQTEDVLKNSVDVSLGEFSAIEGEYSLVATTLPVTVTNKLDKTASFSIKIEAVDANGARLAEDTIYANDLAAGQAQKIEAFKYVESSKLEALKTATFKVATASES